MQSSIYRHVSARQLPFYRARMPQRQEGLTMIALIAILAILAFFIMLTFVLWPIYLDNFKVRSHLTTLKSDTNFTTLSESEIIDKLFSSLRVDDVEGVREEDVTVERGETNIKVTVDYEVRAHTIGNVDVVVSFVNEISADL